jgi:hypothetical protein
MATIRKLKKIAFPTSVGTAVFDSDDFVYSVNNIKPNVANGDVHIDRVNNANHSDAATKVDQKVSASSVTSTAFPANSSYVPDMSFLSYWNGAYSANNQSNLKYCYQGEIIGSSNIARQSVSHAVTSDRSTNATNDENGKNINETYVKLAISQRVTAQHNFPNGVKINGYLVTIE